MKPFKKILIILCFMFSSIALADQGDIPIASQAIIQQNANQLFHGEGDPVAGNPNGKVTITEFFDYQCPHCSRMSNTINKLIAKNHNLRVVFKEFPIFGGVSDLAAKAALAAKNQNKYIQFHDALMNLASSIDNADITAIAKRLNLNMQQFNEDMNSNAVMKQIQANYQLAKALQFNATPIFFIGKTQDSSASPVDVVMGEADLAQLQKLVNREF